MVFEKKIFQNEVKYVLDASNITGISCNKRGKYRLDVLNKVILELDAMGIKRNNIITIADANLKYKIDQPGKFIDLLKHNFIYECPSEIVADKVIISYVLKHPNSYIFSNDRFREFKQSLPYFDWLRNRRVSIMKIQDDLFFIPVKSDEILMNVENTQLALAYKSSIKERKGVIF